MSRLNIVLTPALNEKLRKLEKLKKIEEGYNTTKGHLIVILLENALEKKLLEYKNKGNNEQINP